LKDVLTRIAETTAEKFGAEYAEVRAQNFTKTMLTMKEGHVEAAKQGIENGAAIRVLVDGAWGFASVGSLDEEALTSAACEASRMAKAASLKLKNPIKLAKVQPIEDRVHVRPSKNPSEITMEEKIKNAEKINHNTLGYDKRVRSCTIDYLDLTGTSYFVSNEGTRIEQDMLYVWSRITATASQKGVFASSREEIGSTSGFEIFDIETPEALGTKLAGRAVEQLEAKTPKGGAYPAVLGPNVVGVFVHEAFGHLAEADLALAGGVLATNLGKKIASDYVTFYDDGTLPGAFGSFKYDDEGVRAQKTLLVENGLMKNLMHNRETAHKFDSEPTGNARAEDFRVEPIIRMRNTFMEPRDHTFEELIEDVSFGYYLKSFRGGQANLDGTFQVGVQEAFEIVNGELSEPVRNASISGNTLGTLLRVDAVARDFSLSPGRCGKGQTAFVCDGGPHARVTEVTVGGSA
jgi:TldD protein